MNVFWPAALLLAAFASVLVLWPRGTRVRDAVQDARRAENLAAYRERLAELDAVRETGSLDDGEYQRQRLDLDRALLAEADDSADSRAIATNSRVVLLVVALVIPVASLLLYWANGSSEAVRLEVMLEALQQELPEEQRNQRVMQMLPLLERVAARGDGDGDGEYRYLLARTYMNLGRYADAAVVFQQLLGRYPEDAAIMAQAAQALYIAGGSKLTPVVQSLVDRALAIDPAQPTLLGMIGMARFQAADYAGALEYWQKLLLRLPSDAPDAAIIREGIAMARQRLGSDGVNTPEVEQPTASGDVGGARIVLAVSVAPGLKVHPEDTVFVFARAENGPPMPLAVARFSAVELPREVELNDGMAMAPGLKLSGFPQVRVIARVSRNGTVAAQPGDLEGGGMLVTPAGKLQRLALLIDRQVTDKAPAP